jgi:hypothetical protein
MCVILRSEQDLVEKAEGKRLNTRRIPGFRTRLFQRETRQGRTVARPLDSPRADTVTLPLPLTACALAFTTSAHRPTAATQKRVKPQTGYVIESKAKIDVT